MKRRSILFVMFWGIRKVAQVLFPYLVCCHLTAFIPPGKLLCEWGWLFSHSGNDAFCKAGLFFALLIRLAHISVFQCRNRHDKHAVRAPVSRIGHTAKDAQDCRGLTLGIALKLFFDHQQILCRCIDLVCP